MKPAFWKARRVFLTGHTGFKGSWLALWLERLGAQVVGYSLEPPSQPSLFEMAAVDQGIESIHGDIRDLGKLSASIERHQPEVVLHLAAQSLVRQGYHDPIETYSTNVLGTANVLEAARKAESIRILLSVTSDKCYDNGDRKHGFREGDPLGGKDPYSSSKACAELVTGAYRQSFFSGTGNNTAIASARAGNVIGGGDFAADRLVPDLVRGFLAKQPVLIRRPLAVRPWQHVLEPLSGYLTIVEQGWNSPAKIEGAWNLGPDSIDERPVEWVADRLVALWGDDAAWTRDQRVHPAEAAFLKLDSTKARTVLDWRPRLELAQALEWVTAWHQAIAAGGNARELTIAQIGAYEKLGPRDN